MKAIEMRRWTRAEYDKMVAAGLFAPGERVELIDGEILQMTPQGSAHATVIQLLHEALRLALGPAYSVRPQLPLALARDSEPEPDLAVVAGSPLDYREAHPETAVLVVEVSDNTLEHDRKRKASLYARAGIQDYWIINLVDSCVEVYREPSQGTYRSCRRFFAGDNIALLGAADVMISVAEIFRRQ